MEDANIIMTYIIVTIVVSLICGWIGYLCGDSRQRGTAGLVLGLLFGPIGCVIALFLPAPAAPAEASCMPRRPVQATANTCPMCGKLLNFRAKTCPGCGSAI